MPRQSRKHDDDKRERTFFVRVSPNERNIVETAIKLKYGEVEGFISTFARRAMLLYAKQIIKQARKSES